MADGDVVVVVGDYSPEVVCLLFALMRSGCIVVPVTQEAIVGLDTVLDLAEAQWVIDHATGQPRFSRTGRTVNQRRSSPVSGRAAIRA